MSYEKTFAVAFALSFCLSATPKTSEKIGESYPWGGGTPLVKSIVGFF